MRQGPRTISRYFFRTLAALVIFLVIAIPVIGHAYSLGTDALVGAAKLDAAHLNLPPLVIEPLPQRSTILASDGSPLATFYLQDRVPVGIGAVAPVMKNALISVEDRSFYTNDGVDPKGIARAALADATGHARQGGSTLTQQYVKNLLELQAPTSTQAAAATSISPSRKLKEVYYAYELTKKMSKNKILAGYLNTVYFGANAYGIAAASSRFFSTTPDKLTLPQAALLTALVRSPTAFDPFVHPKAALDARNRAIRMMLANKKITKAQARAASSSPLGLHASTTSNGCAPSPAPFFCDAVRNELLTDPLLGTTQAERVHTLDVGGLVIKTTLSPTAQADATKAAIDHLSTADRVATAVVSITPGTGAITAMAVNRVYGLNGFFNQTTLNLAMRPSPVGSTFKAFTLATAFTKKTPLNTILPAGSSYHSDTMDNPPSGYYQNAEPYSPSNIDLATATADSVNTAFVQLEERLGPRSIASVARSMGLTTLPLTGPDAVSNREGTLTLGARGFTPVQMASAYATLAASGKYCSPTTIASITMPDKTVLKQKPQCAQVITPAVADTVTSLLANVVTSGTGTGAAVPGYQIAGKTGTTSDFGSAWFIGYTPSLATAVWVGDPRGSSYPLTNVAGIGEVFGGTIPASIFAEAMSAELAGTTPQPLPGANETYIITSPQTVPVVYGLPMEVATARLRALGAVVTAPSSGVAGTTSPPAGSDLHPGDPITVAAQ